MIKLLDTTREEDYCVANKYAQQYMKKLFGGNVQVFCQCGNKIHYNGKLSCDKCGQSMDKVGFETDYTDRLIRTEIDIATKTYVLYEADPEDEGLIQLPELGFN